MVKRGRVDRGWTVGLSWAAREGKFNPPGDDDAAEADERSVSTAEGVCVWCWGVGAGSQDLLPTEGVTDTDMGDTDVDKQEPGGVEVGGPDIDMRDGTRPADEEFAPTGEVADIGFGGPGFSS